MIKKCLIVSMVFVLVSASGLLAFNSTGQDGSDTVAQEEPEIQWVWGEVVLADPVSNRLTVKYLDYDTDQENEMVFAVNDKTTYENAVFLGDIKPGSPVGVDYIIDEEGNGIAVNISIENIDSLSAEANPLEKLPEKDAQEICAQDR